MLSCWLFISSTRWHWLYGIVFIAHRKRGFHRITLIYYRFLWLIFNGITQTSLDDPIGYHPWRQVFATMLLESNQKKSRLRSRLSSCWLFIFSTRWHRLYGIVFIAHRKHGKHRFSLFHFDSHRTIRFLSMPLSRKLQIHLHLSIELHTEDKCLGYCVAGI